MTVGSDHSKKMEGMIRTLECAGFLKNEANGIPKKLYGETIASELEFYWIVAPSRYWTREKKRPTTYAVTGNTKKRQSKQDCAEGLFREVCGPARS